MTLAGAALVAHFARGPQSTSGGCRLGSYPGTPTTMQPTNWKLRARFSVADQERSRTTRRRLDELTSKHAPNGALLDEQGAVWG
jgi:hypothetical protein